MNGGYIGARALGFTFGAHFHPRDWGIAFHLVIDGELCITVGPFSIVFGVAP